MDLYDELPETELLYDPEFTQLLQNATQNQVTAVECITLNPKELARLLQRSITEVTKFQQKLNESFAEQFQSKNNIIPIKVKKAPRCFTTGDVNIDELLGGGIYTHCITEVFGESSTGKSQLLMQLALTAQLPKSQGGLEGKSVYITTEGDLPTTRIHGVLEARRDFKNNGVSQQNIFTVSCNDLINQEHILNVQLPILLEKNKDSIKLVIIDSISHHLRVELQNSSFKESQNNRYYIDKMAQHLLKLARNYSISIVVANQVSDKPLYKANKPFYQEVVDYSYQLGWIVGWKNSSILFRQKLNEPLPNKLSKTAKQNNNGGFIPKNKYADDMKDDNMHDDILSDDDDYTLVATEVTKSLLPSQAKQHSEQKFDTPQGGHANLHQSNQSLPHIPHRKRRVDSRIPNLGLSWANHVSTRILLSKAYKASPIIKRGEAHLYKGSDPSAFWQVKRNLKVVFSSFGDAGELSYSITKRGIEAT